MDTYDPIDPEPGTRGSTYDDDDECLECDPSSGFIGRPCRHGKKLAEHSFADHATLFGLLGLGRWRARRGRA